MERYAEVLNYAIPFFMSLLLIERIAAWLMGKKVINSMDTLSSLSSGLTNAIKDVLGLTLVIVSYDSILPVIGTTGYHTRLTISGTIISFTTAVKSLTWHVRYGNPSRIFLHCSLF